MIINTIKQTGTVLQSDDNRLSPQYSENLQIHVVYDDTYSGWSVKWDAIGCREKKRIPLSYDSGTQCIMLNKQCFIDEYLYLACTFVKDGMVVNTEPIEFYIPNSVNHDLDTLPEYPGLYDEMNELFKQIFANEYKQPLDDLFEKNEVLQDKITKTEEVVNKTLSDVNEAIEQSSEAAQNANTAASDANEAALAACAAKTNADTAAASANTAASNANTAAQSANDIASEVERKLQAGEFVGGVGPVGPVGPKGEDGDDGGDTLPIGAQVLWDNSNPIPEGWKEVDTEVHNPKQLLINNDFQINQRGQSEYNFIENGKYGLDMWQQRQGEFSNALIVKPVDDGVELTCQPNVFGGLRQFLSLSAEDIGKEYTVCISVNNVRQTGTFTLLSESQTVFENEIYRVGITRLTGDGYALSILLSNENTREAVNTINYVDLFEGNVDYPHVKEDEAIALMKCRQYVFVTAQKKLAGKVGTGHLEGFDFPIKMKGAPTYTVVAFETTGGADIKRELKSVSCTSRGVAYMTLQSPTQQEYQYTILFSCEPL